MSIKRDAVLWLAILCAGASPPITWIVRQWANCAHTICQGSHKLIEWDFAEFWQVGHMALGHHFSPTSPYPPTSLLIFAPFGLLSLRAAYLVWNLLGIALLSRTLIKGGWGWLGCAMVLVSPPFLFNVLLGQNGAFSNALLIAALVYAGERPFFAGVCAGLLTLKPQLGVLIPVSWLARGRWRSITIAGAVAISLVLLTMLIFGVSPWQIYVSKAVPSLAAMVDAPFPQDFHTNAIAPFILARALGASVLVAHRLQSGITLLVGIATYMLWRGRATNDAKVATTLLLGYLAMPYGYVYDMIGYAAALVLIGRRQGPSPLWALFWLWPAFARNAMGYTGLPLTPLVVAAAAFWSFWLARKERQQTATAHAPVSIS
jgi:hypothetical protein